VTIVQRISDEFIAKGLELSRPFPGLQVVRDDGDARRVVSAVLQAPETPEKDLL
jgi:hypothetical protein